jgi:alpha-beta hydrolase superfamily lysophospholipase
MNIKQLFCLFVKVFLGIYLVSCSSFTYFPNQFLYSDPSMFGHQYENQYLETPDGQTLHAWFMPSSTQNKKGLVTFFHGNAQNLSAHWRILRWMINDGFDLIIYDYRGYGLSTGKANREGIYRDSLLMLEHSKKIYEKGSYPSFIVYAQSLGGAIGARAVTDWKSHQLVDLIVLDSTFLSYQSVTKKVLSKAPFPLWTLRGLTSVLMSDKYAPQETIHKLTLPTIVVHGTSDRVVPYSLGEEVFKRSPAKNKWMVTVQNGAHIDAYTSHGDKYAKQVGAIIDQVITNK